VWANEQRQSRLEKFVVRCITLFQVHIFRLQFKPYQLVLVACLVVLFFVVLYVLLHVHDSPTSQAASHFTIPILSPFTSVVSLFVRYYDVDISNQLELGRTRNRYYQCEVRYYLRRSSGYPIICYLPPLVFKTVLWLRIISCSHGYLPAQISPR